MIDPQLTGWARNLYADDLEKLVRSSPISPPTQARRPTARTLPSRHPRPLANPPTPPRHRARPDRRSRAAGRGAPGPRRPRPSPHPHLATGSHQRSPRPQRPDHPLPHQIGPHPQQGPVRLHHEPRTEPPRPTLTLLADDARALVHTDPDAILDRRANPTASACTQPAMTARSARLLDRLHLERLRPRAPRHKPTPRTIATMLRQALADLKDELPSTVAPQIQPEDESFALETIARQRAPRTPTAPPARPPPASPGSAP